MQTAGTPAEKGGKCVILKIETMKKRFNSKKLNDFRNQEIEYAWQIVGGSTTERKTTWTNKTTGESGCDVVSEISVLKSTVLSDVSYIPCPEDDK